MISQEGKDGTEGSWQTVVADEGTNKEHEEEASEKQTNEGHDWSYPGGMEIIWAQRALYGVGVCSSYGVRVGLCVRVLL